MPGFAAPGVLFVGNSAAQDRAFYRKVFAALPARGYSRYVEVGVGSYAVALVAANAGIPPGCMETSDVTLYSSIVGTCIAGGDLGRLGVHLDGDPVNLPPGNVVDQAAWLLYVQLLARTQAKAKVDYWANLVTDLEQRPELHQAAIRDSLTGLVARLSGLRYQPMCMWDHIVQVADDPHTVIAVDPPTYRAGYEKFFDTDGRLTWREPPYAVFDPEVDMQRLADLMADRKALLLFLQEDETGKAAYPRPVFAHPIGPGRTAYVVSNRPDEVFAITGGPRVSPRSAVITAAADLPVLPYTHQVSQDSRIELRPVRQAVVDYYRDLWMHRLAAGRPSGNYPLLVLIDGHVGGIICYSIDPMKRKRPHTTKWVNHMVLSFAFGAPHRQLRLTRLITAIALRRDTALTAVWNTAATLYLSVSEGVITVETTRHPEAKGLRGLMKLTSRDAHPDGFKLIYEAPWTDKTVAEVLADFVAKEKKWRNRNGGR